MSFPPVPSVLRGKHQFRRVLGLLSLFCLAFATVCPTVLNARPTAEKRAQTVPLSRSERRRLNTFFSNFAEARLNPFTRGNITDRELIQFGLLHDYWNSEPRHTRIAADYIHQMAWRYFAHRIQRDQTIDQYSTFRNGVYYVSPGDGKGHDFAQINRLIPLGKNEWQADVFVYQASNSWEGDTHAAPSSWRNSSPLDHDKPDPPEPWKAVIRKITEGGTTRYVLLEWLRAPARRTARTRG